MEIIALGIETSCDETSLAVVKVNISGNQVSECKILSSIVYSQADIHAIFGGVVPEVASRNHMIKIKSLYTEVIKQSKLDIKDIDLIAVTTYPGLIGALFVGVSFAKGLAYALQKPIYPAHHLAGHILSAEINNPGLKPPYTAIVISGGHTHIYDVDGFPPEFKLIGRTIDDAVGEAFDKVSKMLGGPYPGGPFIEELSKKGEATILFPKALKNSENFSFSGLKTAVLTKIKQNLYSKEDIAASFEKTAAETLAEKAVNAAKKHGRTKLVVAGGVACNMHIREVFQQYASLNGIQTFFPDKNLCGDNAVMIAYAAILMTGGKNFPYDLNFKAGDVMHNIEA